MLLERSQGWGFNEIYFIVFGLNMGDILNNKWLLSLKIQINPIQFKYEELGCAFGIVGKIDEQNWIKFIS